MVDAGKSLRPPQPLFGNTAPLCPAASSQEWKPRQRVDRAHHHQPSRFSGFSSELPEAAIPSVRIPSPPAGHAQGVAEWPLQGSTLPRTLRCCPRETWMPTSIVRLQKIKDHRWSTVATQPSFCTFLHISVHSCTNVAGPKPPVPVVSIAYRFRPYAGRACSFNTDTPGRTTKDTRPTSKARCRLIHGISGSTGAMRSNLTAL